MVEAKTVPAKDGRRIHVCNMAGHSKYWLNWQAGLWVCVACHPPAVDCALAEVWEVVGEAVKEAG